VTAELFFGAALLLAVASGGAGCLWYRARLLRDREDNERAAYVEALVVDPSPGRHHAAGTGRWTPAHTAQARAAEGRHTLTDLRMPAAYLMDRTGEHRAGEALGPRPAELIGASLGRPRSDAQ